MKKLWIILFAVLALAGCANEEPMETTTEAVTTTAETTPPGYYVPHRRLERPLQTDSRGEGDAAETESLFPCF